MTNFPKNVEKQTFCHWKYEPKSAAKAGCFSLYGKCSKILNTTCLQIKTKTNSSDLDQTASEEARPRSDCF